MREEDRKSACEALQEIETDLVYAFIEAYTDGRFEDVAEHLVTLRDLIDVIEAICLRR